MKIGYRKCFNLGNYENEVISIEGDVPDDKDFTQVFENMKNAVEDLHLRSLGIDMERKESEKKTRQEEEERMKAENPCYGCERFGKCDMPMYNRVRCFKYEEASDFAVLRRNSHERYGKRSMARDADNIRTAGQFHD